MNVQAFEENPKKRYLIPYRLFGVVRLFRMVFRSIFVVLALVWGDFRGVGGWICMFVVLLPVDPGFNVPFDIESWRMNCPDSSDRTSSSMCERLIWRYGEGMVLQCRLFTTHRKRVCGQESKAGFDGITVCISESTRDKGHPKLGLEKRGIEILMGRGHVIESSEWTMGYHIAQQMTL